MSKADDLAWLDANKHYGLRLEVVDGVGIWELAPSYEHQDAIDRIRASVRSLRPHGCSCVHKSDVNVRFGDTYKRPDIAFWCHVPERKGGTVTDTPEAVVEVISPGYERKDLELLPPLYLEHGVKDVIVFDYESGAVRRADKRGVFTLGHSPQRIELSCGCEVTV